MLSLHDPYRKVEWVHLVAHLIEDAVLNTITLVHTKPGIGFRLEESG